MHKISEVDGRSGGLRNGMLEGYGNLTQRRRSRRRRRRRDADDGLILTQREAVRAHIKSSLGAMEKQN